MSMSAPVGRWQFGSFELDRERRLLEQDGHAVAITPKAFDLLVLLVERHGQLVTKDEILKALWPDSFVEEGNLSVQISVLRKRLGDTAEEHRYIVTVPGRGYHFAAPVTVLSEHRPPAAQVSTARPEIVWRRTESPRRAKWWWAAGLAAVIAGGGSWVFVKSEGAPPLNPARSEAARRIDPEAERLYLRGRYLLGKRTEQSLRRGISYFEAALARDAAFVPAHSGLADAYSILGYFGFEAPLEILPKARAAAARALALDPRSAEAHTSLAYIQHRYEWRFADAERAFRRAIELQPAYALARHWYASFLEAMNRYDEAIAQSAKAEELEPVSPVISANFAGILNSAQRGPRAMAQWDKALELDEGFWASHLALAEMYAEQDMPEEALAAFRRSMALAGDNPKQLAALARFHAASGRLSDARRLLATLNGRAERQWVSPADLASIHAALGETDDAFRWLERAIEKRDPLIAYLAESDMWRRLRHDSRFASLLARVGLHIVSPPRK
jgi:DNA-binding winged helix-turn-helix (wHTH) protein/tetratricopeptide (TPR) repeat protein